jgi:hypothetical protein
VGYKCKLFTYVCLYSSTWFCKHSVNSTRKEIILREIGREGVDWIDLAQDRDKWWAVMTVVMNLWVP